MKTISKMKIREYDCPTRYWVNSSSGNDDDEYLVDLKQSVCTCEHFRFRLWVQRKEGKPVKQTMCKHLFAAREHLLDIVLEKL